MAKRAGERDAAARFEETEESAPPVRSGLTGKRRRTLSAARASGPLLGPPIWHARRILSASRFRSLSDTAAVIGPGTFHFPRRFAPRWSPRGLRLADARFT